MTIWKVAAGAATSTRVADSVVAVGTFDGVHRGHQHVLDQARAVAAGLPVVAVTFDPHPLRVVRPDVCPPMLTSMERRIELLAAEGADEVRVLDFSADMAAWTPATFIDKVLVDELRARHVVVGENFRFGHRNSGDVDVLRASGFFAVTGVPLLGDDEPFTSSRVRALLADSRVREAAGLLGRRYEVVGTVAEGDKRGRELGFPTANVPVDSAFAVPADGVYACWLVVGEVRHPAATSVGTNPTFGEHDRRVESFVIDHPTNDLDLYGLEVTVEFVEHLRPMVTFDSVEALVTQMHHDVSQARKVLAAD